MTYRNAVRQLVRLFPGRMFTYDDPKATVPTPGAGPMWGDALMADTMDREENGPIPGEYVVDDGAIWLLNEDGRYPIPMVQAIL